LSAQRRRATGLCSAMGTWIIPHTHAIGKRGARVSGRESRP
jgi:hypothetical protein